ncbi:MAG: hypothetical protein L5657_07075, partial [Calditerricola sp.]|nr:hypothetical protein [Calditerricola sp.]
MVRAAQGRWRIAAAVGLQHCHFALEMSAAFMERTAWFPDSAGWPNLSPQWYTARKNPSPLH